MINTKNDDDRGSPYLMSLMCQMGGPDSPLSITLKITMDKRMATSSQKPKPKAYLA
jgi:hypothetical protein